MNFKQVWKIVLVGALACGVIGMLTACGGGSTTSGNNQNTPAQKEFTIAVPSDTTNEARALQLLQAEGLITLKEGVGLKATANDIVDNPFNVRIIEAEAASLPRTLQDVDFAVINGNYALSAGIDPALALAGEDAASEAAEEYANIIAVRAESMGSEKTKVLVETLQSEEVRQFITDTYQGAVVPVNIEAMFVSDGEAVSDDDKNIVVGASPAPHAEILEFARPLLEAQGYTLEVIEFADYIQPNVALEDGTLDANYFQHFPYLEEYNEENGTTLASAGKIHFEPLRIYAGKTSSLAEVIN